jgi:ribosomal protein S12 methylthiotransferase accessory factor
MISPNTYLSFSNLREPQQTSIDEALFLGRRLVSKKTGIISRLEFGELLPGEPQVNFARATPADTSAFCAEKALNFGDGTSIDNKRALMKAVGESVERYCSSQFDMDDFLFSSYDDIEGTAVNPNEFALFSERQYKIPDFPFEKLNEQTPVFWSLGYSLTNDHPVYIPTGFVYVPYRFTHPKESRFHISISTGLACGTSRAMALYKGLMETIERDAFMIAWRNKLSLPLIDLDDVSDPTIRQLIEAFSGTPVQIFAISLTLDIDIPVVLVILRSLTGKTPYTSVGISADLNPTHALRGALEESFLTLLGMNRFAKTKSDYIPEPFYKDLKTPIDHAIAHGVFPDLQKEIDFLVSSKEKVSIQDLPNRSQAGFVENIGTTANLLKEKGLETIALDITTPDIDEAGFKVVRAIVPGLHPLDIDHNTMYLGGKRLYQAPCDAGLLDRPLKEEELNMAPHCFP